MIDIKFNKTSDAQVEFILDSEKSKSQNLKKAREFGFDGKGKFFVQESKTLIICLDKLCVDLVREAAAGIARFFKHLNFQSVGITVFAESKNNDELNYALMLGVLAGEYDGNLYKKERKDGKFKTLVLNAENLESNAQKKLEKLAKKAHIVAKSLNITRDLVNTPPDIATPKFVADFCDDLAQKLEIKCQILNIKDLQKEKMGAFLAVSRASAHEPYLVHLTYKPQKSKSAPKLVLVGKGLTYDSGGLSLKPSDYMVSMKADKSGACAVIGAINAIVKLNLEVEVHCVLGLTENMIGGNAYKPDDVLFSREGKSIEVRNTDAEGRLVLADCLSYAQDLKPDILIDLATLTGACVVGLGEYTSGVMGFDENLKNAFEKCALKSGELAARLPFNRHIRKLIDSKIADVCNISSSRYGGAISAGMFLGEFIRDEFKQKWVHFDIAGPAYVEKDWDINASGASGAGVRAVLEFAKFLEQNGANFQNLDDLDSQKCCLDSENSDCLSLNSESKRANSKKSTKGA